MASYKPLFVLTIVFSVGLVVGLPCDRRTAPTAPREKKISQGHRRVRHQDVDPRFRRQLRRRHGRRTACLLVLSPLRRRPQISRYAFFISNFLAALSFLSAPIIARYFGIVRTMAFSHGFASLIYLSIPFAPTFFLGSRLFSQYARSSPTWITRCALRSPWQWSNRASAARPPASPVWREPCPLASARRSRHI